MNNRQALHLRARLTAGERLFVADNAGYIEILRIFWHDETIWFRLNGKIIFCSESQDVHIANIRSESQVRLFHAAEDQKMDA